MTDSSWFPQLIRGEYVLSTLFGLERLWNGHGADTQRNVNFEILHSLVWKGGVWKGIRGLVPHLWIEVWIGMWVSPCSGPIALSSSHIAYPLQGKRIASTHELGPS